VRPDVRHDESGAEEGVCSVHESSLIAARLLRRVRPGLGSGHRSPVHGPRRNGAVAKAGQDRMALKNRLVLAEPQPCGRDPHGLGDLAGSQQQLGCRRNMGKLGRPTLPRRDHIGTDGDGRAVLSYDFEQSIYVFSDRFCTPAVGGDWCSDALIRRGVDPGGWVGEVEAECAVEGFFGGAARVTVG
jgi:hypothetical protein